MPALTWLRQDPEWKRLLAQLPQGDRRWETLKALADYDIDFIKTSLLDRRLMESVMDGPVPLRLAILSSCTVDQLVPGLRVAALRRGIRLDVYRPDYGQYRQALLDPKSFLDRFQPQVIVFSFDARVVVGNNFIADTDAAQKYLEDKLNELIDLWRVARDRFGAQVIQQTVLPVFPNLLGESEHRVLGAPAAMIRTANAKIRDAAAIENVDILAIDTHVQRDGISAWHSEPLWQRAKQEITPAAAPLYGDLVLRIVAARRGMSAKCVALDLDNTLWGGVIGDDGLEGIVLGEGSAAGEAFLDFQRYVKALAQRGVIVAICSKNDEANALEAFDKHPEMILRRTDIAAFVANWDDKATNLRRIASELNIGLDTIVFADDNPFERNIVRRELSDVKVPELPDDPTFFADTIAAAGYFEAIELTQDDLARGKSYQATHALRTGSIKTSDLEGYLASLDMQLSWGRFDAASLKRITQLINKTNQFNLTTRRYTEVEVATLADDPNAIGLHLRLVDRHADHGLICVLIGRVHLDKSLEIDTWLMSCRVLGRGVELATLSILVDEARRRGFKSMVGRYRPTAKNGMVRDHYERLGFDLVSGESGLETLWRLDLTAASIDTPNIRIKEIAYGRKPYLQEAN
jgi:FkbH-like protein